MGFVLVSITDPLESGCFVCKSVFSSLLSTSQEYFLFHPALHVLETSLCVFFLKCSLPFMVRMFFPLQMNGTWWMFLFSFLLPDSLPLFTISLFILFFTLWVIIYSQMSSSVPGDELYNKILNLVVCRVNVLCVKAYFYNLLLPHVHRE
jgi:hypothetical protein